MGEAFFPLGTSRLDGISAEKFPCLRFPPEGESPYTSRAREERPFLFGLRRKRVEWKNFQTFCLKLMESLWFVNSNPPFE
jgi:hypothetical protein